MFLTLLLMSNGMVKPGTFFEVLVELCSLQNVVVHFATHVDFGFKCALLRDNVTVEGICLKDKILKSMEFGRMHTRIQFGLPGCAKSKFSPDWGSVIQLMNQIALGDREEQIQVVAVSVMNLIIMNPCSERERFGQKLLFGKFPKAVA